MQKDIDMVSLSTRGLSDELSVIKRNQADFGSKMFSGAGVEAEDHGRVAR
jgi:hypothetical protein